MYSLDGGLETFVEALRGRLKADGVEIRTNAKVKSVSGARNSEAKEPNVVLQSGENISSDHGECVKGILQPPFSLGNKKTMNE